MSPTLPTTDNRELVQARAPSNGYRLPCLEGVKLEFRGEVSKKEEKALNILRGAIWT